MLKLAGREQSSSVEAPAEGLNLVGPAEQRAQQQGGTLHSGVTLLSQMHMG